MFVLSYTIIYFFVKNFLFRMFIFQRIKYSNFLFVFWLRNRPSIKYVRNKGIGGGSSKMCTGAYRGRGVSRLMCKYALTLSPFMFLPYTVLFCRNLTLASFKKDLFVRNGYFSPKTSVSVKMK